MGKSFLMNYAKNMSKEDIYNYISKNGYDASNEEVDIIYEHIKKYYNVFFDNPIYYIKLLKGKISDVNYYQILELFDKYKGFL